jgi:hypothetical protein
VGCKDAPNANAEVLVVLTSQVLTEAGPTKIALGSTDAKGELRVDLGHAIPETLKWTEQRFPVLVNQQKAGDIGFLSLLAAREAEAWQAVRGPCEDPQKSDWCGRVDAFLKQYPGGPHATEARALLDKMAPKLRSLSDEEAWQQTKLKECATAPAQIPDEIDQFCAPLEAYISNFPEGVHARDVREALAKGHKRRDALADKLTKQAELEAKAEQRRERAAAQRERAKLVEQCQSACLMRCSNAVREGSCLAGCVQLCEHQGGI